ncbi:hypothetical protein K438DRAFT_1755970 [Mycena galopus ATCC 62051]|nr:hypothetical protein K438DRAFT_1755970 [Mycena galopus ATCC 62051]
MWGVQRATWVLRNLPCINFLEMVLQLSGRPKLLFACTMKHEILSASDVSGEGWECYIRVKRERKEGEGIGSGWVMTGLGNAGGQRKNEGGGKEDSRGLPEVKAGKPEEKCRRPERSPLCGGSRIYKSGRPGKVFDKSSCWTEDGSQVCRPEYSDVGGSVKTTENDGKPNNVNNQSKTFYSNSREPERSREDRNVKPEEDGDERMITGSHPVVVQMSSGVEPEVRRSGGGVAKEVVKAEVDLPHRRRKFEPEDERHPESGGLSQKRLNYAGVRVGDPANTEGMNEGGREPEVQRKSRKKAKVKVRKRKWMKKFQNPNSGGCEMEPTGFGDSPKVTIADERTSPIARPEVVSKIVAELFRSRNLLHVCPTVELERMEVSERRNAETKAEGGDATTCIFATRSISANRKIRGKRWESRRRTEISPTSSNANPGNGNGRKGERKPDGMLEQLPEEGMERTEDAGKDVYAGHVKSEKDRPGGESEVDSTHRKFAGAMSVIVHRVRHGKPEPERTGEFGKTEVEVQKRTEVRDKSGSGRKLGTIEVREEIRWDGSEVMEWPVDSRRSSGSSGP